MIKEAREYLSARESVSMILSLHMYSQGSRSPTMLDLSSTTVVASGVNAGFSRSVRAASGKTSSILNLNYMGGSAYAG